MAEIGHYNYENVDLRTKAGWVEAAKGGSVLEPALAQMKQLADGFYESNARLSTNLQVLGSAWEGTASDAAQQAMRVASARSVSAQEANDKGHVTVSDHGTAFEEMRRRVHYVDPNTNWQPTNPTGIVPIDPFTVMDDHAVAMQQYRNLDTEANRALYAYEQRTRELVAQFPDLEATTPASAGGPGAAGPAPDNPTSVHAAGIAPALAGSGAGPAGGGAGGGGGGSVGGAIGPSAIAPVAPAPGRAGNSTGPGSTGPGSTGPGSTGPGNDGAGSSGSGGAGAGATSAGGGAGRTGVAPNLGSTATGPTSTPPVTTAPETPGRSPTGHAPLPTTLTPGAPGRGTPGSGGPGSGAPGSGAPGIGTGYGPLGRPYLPSAGSTPESPRTGRAPFPGLGSPPGIGGGSESTPGLVNGGGRGITPGLSPNGNAFAARLPAIPEPEPVIGARPPTTAPTPATPGTAAVTGGGATAASRTAGHTGMPFMGGGAGGGGGSSERKTKYWIPTSEAFDVELPPHVDGVIGADPEQD